MSTFHRHPIPCQRRHQQMTQHQQPRQPQRRSAARLPSLPLLIRGNKGRQRCYRRQSSIRRQIFYNPMQRRLSWSAQDRPSQGRPCRMISKMVPMRQHTPQRWQGPSGGEMQQMVQDGFSILLPAADAVQIFVETLKLSRIAAVPQAQLQLRLILNLSAQPDKITPSINDTIDREISPESMQFGQAFPRILQAI